MLLLSIYQPQLLCLMRLAVTRENIFLIYETRTSCFRENTLAEMTPIGVSPNKIRFLERWAIFFAIQRKERTVYDLNKVEERK